MVPGGWLGKLLKKQNWNDVQTHWAIGGRYNVFASGVQFCGHTDDNTNWIFSGTLDIPKDHLQTCCLAAKGAAHDCGISETRRVLQTIFWKVHKEKFDSNFCDLPNEASLVRVQFDGWVEPPTGFKGLVGESVHREGGHDDSKAKSGLGESLDASAFTNGQSDQTVDGNNGNGEELGRFPMFTVLVNGSYFLPKISHDLGHLMKPQSALPPLAFVELFAGAFAGWKQALIALDALGYPSGTTHAVEIDEFLARMYQTNFGTSRFHFEHEMKGRVPCPCVDPLEHESSVYVGDVQNFEWIQTVPWGHLPFVMMSPPCPAWGRSSPKDGLLDHDGRLFVYALASLRYVRPAFVVWKMLTQLQSIGILNV